MEALCLKMGWTNRYTGKPFVVHAVDHVIAIQGQCLISYPGSPWIWGIIFQPRFAEKLTEAVLRLDPNKEPQRKICIFVDDEDFVGPAFPPSASLRTSQGKTMCEGVGHEAVSDAVSAQHPASDNAASPTALEPAILSVPKGRPDLAVSSSQHPPVQRRYLQETQPNQQRLTVDENDPEQWEEWVQRRKAFRALRDY